ncbi:hypothetical protein GCM10008967_00210 [Bacillus carboniphilus]|uniref:Phage protein n=1 Tax=Bacillus carboniphilus TaxID=86663 RepID=A0ABN0VP21_9BACI
MRQIGDEVLKWAKHNRIPLRSGATTRKNSKKEKLSKHDLIDLMGMNRPTYRRNKGAFRQR